MKLDSASRRQWLGSVAGAIGGGFLAANWSAVLSAAAGGAERRDKGLGFEHLSADQAQTLEAFAEQIFPTDDTPGAREAGVVWFFDQWIAASPDSRMKGANDAISRLNDASGSGGNFDDLSFDEQTRLMRDLEKESFFSFWRQLTIAGMFALPSRGGNIDRIGWELTGFDSSRAWQPPFGHYDAVALDGDPEEPN